MLMEDSLQSTKKVQKIHVILACCSNLPLRQQSQLQMSQPQANTFEKTNLNILKIALIGNLPK